MPKILLVEDNEMNRDMLSRRLRRKNYDVVLALDGQSGVEMAQTQSPDLILIPNLHRLLLVRRSVGTIGNVMVDQTPPNRLV